MSGWRSLSSRRLRHSARSRSPTSRRSDRPARTSSGCRRARQLVEKMLDMAQGDAAGLRHGPRLGRRPQHHRRGQARRARRWASSSTPTWSSCRSAAAARPASATRRPSSQGDMYAADISQGDGAGAVPAARQSAKLQPKFLDAAAGHAHRHQHVRHRAGRRTRPRRSSECVQLVHVAALIVPAKVAGRMARRRRRRDADAEVPDGRGDLAPATGAPAPVKGRLRGNVITVSLGPTDTKAPSTATRWRVPRRRGRARNRRHANSGVTGV